MAMSGKDKEVEGRYLHLLQPNRDLAANWTVDVAQDLEKYLAELALTTLFDDGQYSLNFAEAALLIQGSIQVYSRKVEYLYALVLQALDVIGNKKQAQKEPSSTPGSGKDGDIEPDEEEFLNLDDVPEEQNIDIENEDSGGYITPAIKPPASLLVVEGDNINATEDIGELLTYQIATSSLHRDFLLLDPCDAGTVDMYLNTNSYSRRSSKKTPCRPSSASRSKHCSASTPGQRASSIKRVNASEAFKAHAQERFQGYEDVCGQWGDQTCEEHVRNINFEDADLNGNSENNQDSNAVHEEEEEDDPWAPLNPHDTGTLPIRPFQKGRLYRRQKIKDHIWDGDEVKFPLASRTGVILPEFAEAWHKKQAETKSNHKLAGNSATEYEKLRNSFQISDEDQPNEPLDASGESQSKSFDNDQHSDEEDHGAPDIFEGHLPFEQPEDHTTELEHLHVSNKVDHHEEGMAFEDLCRSHMDKMLQKLLESEGRTELASRVSNWKLKIEVNLEEQESRPPFDIHACGEQLMSKLMSNTTAMKAVDPTQGDIMQEGDGEQSFADLVQGQKLHEVARSFAALLQLVNNGNVDLKQNCSEKASDCFTKENSFTVKIVSVQRRHEEMLHYQAPSKAAKALLKAKSLHQTHLRSRTLEALQPIDQVPDDGNVTMEHLENVDPYLRCQSSSVARVSPHRTATSNPSPILKTNIMTYSVGNKMPESEDSENLIPIGNINTALSKVTPQHKRRRKFQVQAFKSLQRQSPR